MYGTDELYAAVGMVVAADVGLEFDLVILEIALVGTPAIEIQDRALAEIKQTNLVPVRVRRCQERLERRSDLESGQRDALDEALRAAARAHASRNRVAHDLWIPRGGILDPATPESWRRLRVPVPDDEPPVNTVADVHAVRDELLRCGMRCVAGALAVLAVSGLDPDGSIEPQWDVVRGEFDFAPWPDLGYTRWSDRDEAR